MPESPLALIVGANRGLGLGLARELLQRGFGVIATARDPDGAEELAALAAAHPGKLSILPLDLAIPADIDGFAGRLDARMLDVLFVNAGVAGPAHRSTMEATPEEVGALMFVNAVAPVRLARLLLDRVREGSGILAFMSSLMGSVEANTAGNHELYRASKAALNSLTRGLFATLGGRRITVLSMHPGWVRTDMGGAQAPLDIETSVRGLADVLAREAGSLRHGFIDYAGAEIPW
ncbi:MAG: SDR family oxidoreductase [Rhodospirillales bacterium]|nr:SDR family oxidoreductase [Rhodospirillales bacterium]